MSPTQKTASSGFTLVELLVVISIIATLAGLGITILPKALKKGKATQGLANMRQFSTLLQTYAADHSMMLPAAKNNPVTIDGVVESLTWAEVCLNQVYPSVSGSRLKEKVWWTENKPFLINPLFKAWTPATPGYAWNEMLVINVEAARESKTGGDPQEIAIPMVAISDPGRTPLIVPATTGLYRLDRADKAELYKKSPADDLLVDGRFSVLFADGHMEAMAPLEYFTRGFSEAPRPSGQ
jgi:prepilin-type N-terminal cleavage/methylation domain-containing protein/prepilin-type processing-associated H-X9-DG protein